MASSRPVSDTDHNGCALSADDSELGNGFVREAGRWLLNWPDGLVALDELGRIVFMSPKAEGILGFNNANVHGKSVHGVLCSLSRGLAHPPEQCPLCFPEDSPPSTEAQSTLWLNNEGNNISVDYRLIVLPPEPEGPQAECADAAANKGLSSARCIVSFQSNEAREHNQEELENFAQYVDKSPAPMGEFDLDGQLIFGNTALQEQLLEQGYDDAGNARVLPKNIVELCVKTWEQQRAISHIDVEVDGLWWAWHFYPMEGGGESSIVGYAFDITEQKKAEADAAREKAEARRDFYAKMVHELRTPLNAIVGFSQMLQKRLEGNVSDRDFSGIKAIRTAGLQLNELISDTLDISKIDAGKMDVQREQFSVKHMFSTFEDQLAGLAEVKKLEYSVSCEDNLQCYSDPKKVRQIIINLVSNAIKYTPDGGVTVAIKHVQHPTIGSAIGCEVADTGVGIPKDQIDKLFVAYEQVSEEKNKGIQGTGLGLALVAELVRMLDGDIQVVSEQGKGSVFSVYWPVTPPGL